MSKINNLRKLVKTKLNTLGITSYYEMADADAMYPHIVFSFKSSNPWINRDDITMDIDVYYKSTGSADIENTCDSIEGLFHAENLPQDSILPTFYLEGRQSLIDEDKTVRHRLIRFSIQNYER